MIIRRFGAILLQSLCLALPFFCLDGANGQPYPIPNSAEAKSETDQLFEKANELYLKKDYDAVLPLLDRCLLLFRLPRAGRADFFYEPQELLSRR